MQQTLACNFDETPPRHGRDIRSWPNAGQRSAARTATRMAVAAIVLCHLLLLAFVTTPTTAQGHKANDATPAPIAMPNREWAAAVKQCLATAKAPVTERAAKVAAIARNEFYYFGGHRIDSNGRLFSFGVVESEQEESDDNIQTYRLGHLGWWQVLRYWRLYGEDKLPVDAARESLRLRGFADATRSPDDKDIEPPVRMALARALEALEQINGRVGLTAVEKEILREAVIRAAINDVAWSAAFISAVMRQAGLSEEEFAYSDAHAHYIYSAFASALDEVQGSARREQVQGSAREEVVQGVAQKQLYRACPAGVVRPRVGDLLCYHRHGKDHGNKTGAEVRALVLADIASGAKERAIRRSHCDVVAHVDRKTARAYVVGGNVQQSVSIKKLQLDRRTGGLREVQPDNCALDGKWTFPGPDAGKPVAPHLSSECTLNRKTWFVLLQARG